jgi:murein DD-endopeptidase MepM/ murein hydrolase activator NlpD
MHRSSILPAAEIESLYFIEAEVIPPIHNNLPRQYSTVNEEVLPGLTARKGMLPSSGMAKNQLSQNKNLPARRRVVRWEGGESSAPPTLVRRSLQPIRRSNSWHPHAHRRHFSPLLLIKRLLLVGVSLLIIVAARRLADFFIQPQLRGIAPQLSLVPDNSPGELPAVSAGGSATLVYKIRRGDSLSSIAQHYGISAADITALSTAAEDFRKQHNVKHLLPVRKLIEFTFRGDGALNEVSIEPESGQTIMFERLTDDSFGSQLISEQPTHSERVAVGVIETSFAAAATKAGVRYDIVDDLVDLFSNRVEFKKDFHVGDRFTVIYRDVLLADGRPAGGSQILAAALEVNGEHLVAARYVGSDGKSRFFDEKGEMLGNSFLRYPLKFSRISSVFTTGRFHPILKIKRPHNGVDFAAPMGTPVRSVADGTVVFAGANGGSGNMIKIKHSDRYSTAYLHLSSISRAVKKGAHVRRGDVIGAVGMTGLATGPHLHFSFYDNNKYVDPLSIKLPMLDALDAGTKIDPSYLKRVLFTVEHYQTVELEHFYTDDSMKTR